MSLCGISIAQFMLLSKLSVQKMLSGPLFCWLNCCMSGPRLNGTHTKKRNSAPHFSGTLEQESASSDKENPDGYLQRSKIAWPKDCSQVIFKEATMAAGAILSIYETISGSMKQADIAQLNFVIKDFLNRV